jgi:hypothetical protein
LRLAHGADPKVADAFAEAVREQAVDYVFADFGGESAADDGLRHFAGAEAGKLGVFLIIANNVAEGFGHFLRGDIEHQFAGAIRIEYRTMLMFVGLMFVVMVVFVIVAFVALRFFGCTRCGVGFESVSGAQRCTFRARQAPNLAATGGCRQTVTASCGADNATIHGKRVCGGGQTGQAGRVAWRTGEDTLLLSDPGFADVREETRVGGAALRVVHTGLVEA